MLWIMSCKVYCIPKQTQGFYVSAVQVFRKLLGKGEIACNEHGVFYPYRELSVLFFKLEIVFSKLLQFGRV